MASPLTPTLTAAGAASGTTPPRPIAQHAPASPSDRDATVAGIAISVLKPHEGSPFAKPAAAPAAMPPLNLGVAALSFPMRRLLESPYAGGEGPEKPLQRPPRIPAEGVSLRRQVTSPMADTEGSISSGVEPLAAASPRMASTGTTGGLSPASVATPSTGRLSLAVDVSRSASAAAPAAVDAAVQTDVTIAPRAPSRAELAAARKEAMRIYDQMRKQAYDVLEQRRLERDMLLAKVKYGSVLSAGVADPVFRHASKGPVYLRYTLEQIRDTADALWDQIEDIKAKYGIK